MAFPLSSQIFTNGNTAAFSNSVTAGQLAGSGNAISNLTGANVVGNVAGAVTAGTVTTNAQPNITTVGTLSSLSVTGNVSAGNIISAGTFQSATITSPSIAIPYSNTVSYTANVITLNGNTLYRANSNIAANIPFAIGNTANTWSMVQQWTKSSRAWYIDPTNGLDTNDGSVVSPYRTIARGLAVAGGSGSTIVLNPGTYTEDLTVTNPNLNIVGITLGSGALLSGNITANLAASPASSIRAAGIRFGNLTFTGAGGALYLTACQIDNLTHSGTGYLEMVDSESEVGLVTVSGAGTLSAFQGNLRRLTVANASALVTTQDVVFTSANIIVSGGTALINNGIISAPTANANVITSSAGTVVYVNYTTMNTTTGAAARVSLGGFYSFTSAVVDLGNSVLGTNLNAVQITDSLNVLGLANAASINSRSTITATGNITTATGNVSGGNLLTGGRVVASGNVTGNFIIGNGSLLTNITGANVTGTVPQANVVTNPSQPNITSVGTLTSLTTDSLTTTGQITANGNAQFNGDVFFAGNVTIPGNINQVSGNSGQFFGNSVTGFGALYAGLPAGYTLLNQEVMQYATNFNGYTQVSLRNIDGGNQATGDFVITADNGTDFVNHIDMGMAGSGYNGSAANNSLGTSLLANDGYLYTRGNVTGGNLVLGSNQANGVVRIIANGQSNLSDVVATFAASGLTVANTVIAAQIGNAATYLYGDGSNITGLPAGYTNSNVATYLASGTNTANIITTGNISANFVLGDGSQLTNLPVQPGTYGDANVTTLLEGGTVATNIITTANVDATAFNAVTSNVVVGTAQAVATKFGTAFNITSAAGANDGNNGVNINITAGDANESGGTPAEGGSVTIQSGAGTTAGQIFIGGVGSGNIIMGGPGTIIGVNTEIRSNSNINAPAFSNLADNVIVRANAESWIFDNTGNLNLPGNTFAVNYANGTPVSLGVSPSIDSITSGANIIPVATNTQFNVTALAVSASVDAPTGSPVDGAKLTIRIRDNGSAQALTWNAIYQVIGTTLPTTTVANKYVYVGCIYNSQSSKWDVVSVAQEA